MQRAILIMFVAMSLIPAGDSAGKILSTQLGVEPVFIAWSRFALGACLVVPFLPKHSLALFGNWRIWLRAAFLTGGITSIQLALKTTDIATVFAAFFVGPIVSYVLAAVFLKEPISVVRSMLIVLGFVGVLVVVRPGLSDETGVLWAVVAGLCYAVFLTMSRWLSDVAPPLPLIFSQLAISALLLLPFGLIHLPPLTPSIVALTGVSAACSALGNLLLLVAYRLAPATRLAPLIYFQLIAAVALGWAIFADLPDMYTWAGLVLIIISGLGSARLR